jgi:hypothetical protein
MLQQNSYIFSITVTRWVAKVFWPANLHDQSQMQLLLFYLAPLSVLNQRHKSKVTFLTTSHNQASLNDTHLNHMLNSSLALRYLKRRLYVYFFFLGLI